METVLHAGCGGETIPSWLADYKATRLDINPACNPDIVADLRELPLENSSYDVVYCSHTLEHFHPYDVPKVLQEFRRVIKSQGRAILTVPDLEGVMPTTDVLFHAPAGPITGLDMWFGYRPMTRDNPYMAHKTGFVQWTLEKELNSAGFSSIVRRIPERNLLAVAVKP